MSINIKRLYRKINSMKPIKLFIVVHSERYVVLFKAHQYVLNSLSTTMPLSVT